MNAQFRSSLSNLESKFNALLNSLTTSPTAAGAPTAALSLLEADDSLTTAVTTLRQHQENYAKIVRLRAEAESLEEKVKGIVREVVSYEKDIQTACNDYKLDDSDADSDDDDDDVTNTDKGADAMEGVEGAKRSLPGVREIDYKILLEFARRISKYNHQAAEDAAAGAPPRINAKQHPDTDTEMTNANGTDATGDGAVEPVANVTKSATSWLDESAQMTRQAYMLPYPMEDRIRAGLMGQIQLAAGEGRPGFDAEKEVYRLIQEAEGFGVADGVAPTQMGEEARHAGEAARAAANAGSAAMNAGAAAAAPPPPKPKATLDLDLYDPDDDDI